MLGTLSFEADPQAYTAACECIAVHLYLYSSLYRPNALQRVSAFPDAHMVECDTEYHAQLVYDEALEERRVRVM